LHTSPIIGRGRVLPLVVACLAFLTLSAPSSASAIDDPSLEYRTLETPHFRVHYYRGVQALARRTATLAEQAHQVLVPEYGTEPNGKTHIVVNDKVDVANGSANVLGRNVIRIYGMPPSPDGVLGYYDDWLRILVFHEYVHILHMETSNSLFEALNLFLGETLHPNAVLPRWYVEGIAVHSETEQTGTGRVNSSLFRMYLRTAVLDDRFFTLGQITGRPTSWPMGNAPYLYGAFFVEYITERYGNEFVRKFNHNYGDRIVPFSLNAMAQRVSGKTFHELWGAFEAATRARVQARRIRVEAEGRTQLQVLTDGGGTHRYPRRRPGTDSVTYFESGLNDHPRYAEVTSSAGDRSDVDVDTLFEIEGASGPSDWTPDGEALVYARGTITDNVYTYQDLFAYRPSTGNHRRLTDADRAREPAVSPSGDRIAFVRNRAGTMELVVCDFRSLSLRNCRVPVGGRHAPDDSKRHWQQIAGPRWTPDGDGIVFSWWRLDVGHRDLWHLRLNDSDDDDGRLVNLTDDAAQDIDPTFGPSGHLYFASDRTGIYNIFARDMETGETWQVSNVVRGLFSPWVGPDGEWIYAATYTGRGYELARFRRPGQFDHSAPSSYPAPAQPAHPEVTTGSWRDRPYRPGRWLGPLLFRPRLAAASGGTGVGVTLQGREPLGDHRWSINGDWSTGPEFTDQSASVSASYTWAGGPFDLTLGAGFRRYPNTQSLVAESRSVPYREHAYRGSLSLNYPLRRIDDNLNLSTSFRVERTSFGSRPQTTPSPDDTEPSLPDFGWFNELNLSLSYINLDSYPQSISPEQGIYGRIGLSVQNDWIGSTYDQVYLNYSLHGYIANPWVDRHTLALKLDGGIARSNYRGAAYGLGGYRPQDILTSIVFQRPSGQFVLRGFPPNTLVGNQFQRATAEYRFPIWRIEAGPSTVPFFIDELKGEVFSEGGAAFDGLLSGADFRFSAGAELLLGLQIGYYFGSNLRVGYARGFGADGINEWYILYGGGF